MSQKYRKINEDLEKEKLDQVNKIFVIKRIRLGRLRIYKNIIVIVIVLILCNLLLSSHTPQLKLSFRSLNEFHSNSTEKSVVSPKYLIDSPKCKIHDIDPFAKDVMAIYNRIEYEPCSDKPPLTYIEKIWSNDTMMLHLDLSAVDNYTTSKDDQLACCYQGIVRDSNYEDYDGHKILSSCHSFDTVVELPPQAEFILVKCTRNSSNSSEPEQVSIDAHALIRRKPKIVLRFEAHAAKNPLSVLLIGIDSLSRVNFLRTMPKTAKYLHDSRWLELRGYNKVGENTCPTLMAYLAGYNESLTNHICSGENKEFFDGHPFIWNDFREQGYVTAFAEDSSYMNTFNYLKKGFLSQPVDHYLRPFCLAANELLPKKELFSLTTCLGYQNYADYIYQYALDLARQYKGHPYFGLFWTNSFSHDDFRMPSSMDDKMFEYFVELNDTGILNETLVIFLSDHGTCYGGIRALSSGWFEERLPFIFFSLPEWFKKAHPVFVKNLQINRDRLTTPFDLHVTLKHILSLSSDQTYDFPFGQSLFEEVPYDRSCDDAHIPQHWCSCISYESCDPSSDEVKNAVSFAMEKIKTELQEHKEKCEELQLKTVLDAKYANLSSENAIYYLVGFDALPSEAKFEAMLKYNVESNYELVGSISRVNMYGHQGDCVDDAHLRKYCFCKK